VTTPLVTRVNRALNPAASASGSPGWTSLRSFGTGAAGTYSFVSSPSGPWGGNFTVCRKQWTTAQSANNGNVGYQVNADGSNYFPVAEGETVTVSAWMRRIGGSSTTKTFVMRVVFYNQVAVSGAATVGSTITGTSVVADTVNTWFRPSLTVVVPAGALGMQVYPDTASVGDPVFAVGDGLDATALLIESGSTLSDYFDGNSTDTAQRWFEWDGAAHGSTSRQVDLLDPVHTPTARNQLSYWDVSGVSDAVLTSLATNPTPGSTTNWQPNVSANWTHAYNATDKCVDVTFTAAGVTAQPNMPASWYNTGLPTANPTLTAGVKYQRSMEVWVDEDGTLTNVMAGAFVGGQALAGGQWTRVVEQFTGTGTAQYVMAASVRIIGAAAGMHVKIRRAQLIVNPDGVALPYFDGSTPDAAGIDYAWTGVPDASTSTATNMRAAGGRWTPLGPPGITGPTGPTGPDGQTARTSCGGCRFRSTQTAQPSGAIWDADNFVADTTVSTDPNPCLAISASNELQVLRNTTAMILTATLRMTNGAPITARSCITFYLNGSVMLGRTSVRENEDTITVTAIGHLALGDRIRVQVFLVTTLTPFGYTCDVTAALTP